MDTDTGIASIPIRFLGFVGGMDYTAEDTSLDQNTLRVIQNAVFNRRGALSHPGNQGPLIFPNGVAHDFCHYYRPADNLIVSVVDKWAHVTHNAGLVNLAVTDAITTVTTTLSNLTSSAGPFDNCVLQVANRLIATDKDNPPAQWYGTGAATTLGYHDPNPIPVSASSYQPSHTPPRPPSRPDTPGLDPYQYTASFEDKWGNETNPIPVFGTLVGNQIIPDNWVRLRVPVAALPLGLDVANVAFVNVWRIGGNNASLRLSNRFVPVQPPVSGFFEWIEPFDGSDTAQNGPNTSIDTTPDSALPDVFANYSNTAPPRGLLVLIEHLGRIFGFGESTVPAVMDELGSPSRLWFSRPYQYNSWGNTDDGIDDDGGFIDIDDNHYDKLLGMATTGSVLVLGRLSSVYTLFGNGFQTFRFDRRADHGIASRRSICRHLNVVRYLGSDFYPYELGNADSVRIGRSVERYIDTLEDASRSLCFSHNGRFFACIPQAAIGAGKTFVLDDRNGAWSMLTEYDINCAHSLEPPTGGKAVLMGGHRVVFDIRGFMNPDSTAITSLPLEIRTDRIRPSPLGDECYFKSIKIDGEFTGGPLTVTVSVENKVKTYTVVEGGFRFLYIDSMPISMTGEWIEIAITGSWNSGEIRRIEIEAIPIRETSNVAFP